MSGPFGSSQWMYSSGGFYPTEIEQSLRFNDNDSAYLSRTPASAGNRKTWTWSGWVKRGNIDINFPALFGCFVNGTNYFLIRFNDSTDVLQVIDKNAGTNNLVLTTNATYRDTSSWYHIVLSVDTTAATSTDRAKLYVNGEQVTSFSATTYPSQNFDTYVNTANQHNIGSSTPVSSTQLFDGYLAEVNFIDGQALDPTSFGEFKSGVWVANEYTGSYGTNGFYLSFSDSAAIGDDLSGNANDWTANNLVATDVVLDSPTNNFAVLNPLFKNTALAALEQGNLYAKSVSGAGGVPSTFNLSSGKWYFETCYISGVSSYPEIGIINGNASFSDLGHTTNTGSVLYRPDGAIYKNTGSGFVLDQTVGTTSTGGIIGVAFDLDNRECSFYVNNTQVGTTVDISYMSNEVIVRIGFGFHIAELIANFGQDSSFAGNKTAQGNTDDNGIGDFYYAPPSGYLALCTANLPDPVIDPAQDDVPSDYFNTVLYTGTGADLDVDTVGFQSDLVWLKSRSNATTWHILADGVRGANNHLSSNNGEAEKTDAEGVGFIADGFSLGADSVDAYYGWNLSGNTYVAWNWLAGNGTSSNTDGSITSTVSVNQKAGFSVVSYTGNGTSGATVGHGLGAEPAMIIIKARSSAYNWIAYHHGNTSAPETEYLLLNATSATTDNNTAWNDTAPSSSVFTLGTLLNVNGNTTNFIAYCFAEVEGYSKFGSYTGNGSTDGPFVHCGFRPAWVMIKETSGTGDWHMYDVARNPYNLADEKLRANTSGAETVNAADSLDFVSNGMKLRNNGSAFNASGDTYIFMAFAELPAKYSLGR